MHKALEPFYLYLFKLTLRRGKVKKQQQQQKIVIKVLRKGLGDWNAGPWVWPSEGVVLQKPSSGEHAAGRAGEEPGEGWLGRSISWLSCPLRCPKKSRVGRDSLAMGMEVGLLSFTSPQAPGCPHLAQGPKVTPALGVLDSKGVPSHRSKPCFFIF